MTIAVAPEVFEKELFPSASRGSAESNGVKVQFGKEARIFIIITVAGTTLDIKIQDSPDNVNWADHTDMNQIGAVTGTFGESITGFGKFLRLKTTSAGNYTFEALVIGKT